MKNKLLIIVIISILAGGIFGFSIGSYNREDTLPKPEVTGGERGQLGIDKNINEETIDKYLNREDSVYRDMRMLEDPGNYAAIGGDSYLSGFVKGFEVVPYPYLTEVKGLPEEVGNSYQGRVLFTEQENGTYKANYKESLEILEYYFPKDKNIFLMCGGGGYAGMTKNLLVSLGWDANKIYNTGGYWFYKGNNNVSVKREVNGEKKYDFYKVNYHNIDFDTLTPVK
jgi:rhodanese-related sulfurtransferase